jgi:hypothetical protein
MKLSDNFFEQKDYIKVLNCLSSIKQFIPKLVNVGKENLL